MENKTVVLAETRASVKKKESSKGALSLVFGILSVVFFADGILSIFALISSIIAIATSKVRNDKVGDYSCARVGRVTGFVGLALSLIYILCHVILVLAIVVILVVYFVLVFIYVYGWYILK